MSAEGSNAGVSGVATDSSGNVYVVDHGNNRIQKFSASGKLLAKWAKLGSGKGRFVHPDAIAVDSQGHVYAADFANERVVEDVRVSP